MTSDIGAVRDLIPSFGFQSRDLPEDENIALWREAVSTLFEVDEFARGEAGRFRADLMSYALGPLVLAMVRADGQRFHRSLKTVALSGIDHVIVQLYRRGGYDGVAGARPIRVRAGDICVLDLALTLETRATDFENITVVVPRPKMLGRIGRLDALHGVVVPSGSAMAGLIGRHLEALAEFAPRMTVQDCEIVVEGSIDLIAACLRAETERFDTAPRDADTDLAVRIRQHIDAQLGDARLSPERLGERFNLSRASLYRLFASHGGVSSYIRSRRLHRAFFDLADSRTSVKEVVRRWHFGSQDSFARAFKAAYGITPRLARAAAVGPRAGAPRAGEADTLSAWMRAIAAP